jgi:hypothetical protein
MEKYWSLISADAVINLPDERILIATAMCSKHKSDVYKERKTELAALDTEIGKNQTITPAQKQTLKGILSTAHTAY